MSTEWITFVEERLGAGAEDLFALLKSTIAEYEKELRRYKYENQRLQLLLDSTLRALSPRVVLVRVAVQLPSLSPGLTPHIKEEHNIKQEETEQQVSVPEFSAVSVKTEESSLLLQRQTEQREDTQEEDIKAETQVHKEDTQGEDIKTETHVHREDTQEEDIRAETHVHTEDTQEEDIRADSETEGDTEHSADTDSVEDWRAPFSCSPAHMDTGTDRNKSTPETRDTVNYGDMSGTGKGAESRKHKCSVCKERFGSTYKLQKHRRVHTGEEPFTCSVCKKMFAVTYHLKRHMRTHTGEKPFSCSVCKKVFSRKHHVDTHMKTHTGEKPFRCSVCNKVFAHRCHFKTHMRTHTGEKPFSCSVCKKVFVQGSNLKAHMKTHRGES
ncbi:hypothetical protein NL108_017523 [Boleophthalmus pectinirostris]|uniref:oocyte zinc finger protein XlCOF8.4-like n=1 Tax=Boleophthalmus pectinirostris TaxID=150288 RepID=UPI00242C9973|nr:oocyte zinc finger protein XlCOF8.4-like [Boleophthalmus pectinirostris]KAJ0069952.1 hypothetical protein NL108_017523 [Boleophthalmus pectinirostris]